MVIQGTATPDEVRRAFGLLGDIAQGRLIRGLSIAATSTRVPHGLGRVPLAWFEVSRKSSTEAIQQAAAPDDKYLYLLVATTPKINGAVVVF